MFFPTLTLWFAAALAQAPVAPVAPPSAAARAAVLRAAFLQEAVDAGLTLGDPAFMEVLAATRAARRQAAALKAAVDDANDALDAGDAASAEAALVRAQGLGLEEGEADAIRRRVLLGRLARSLSDLADSLTPLLVPLATLAGAWMIGRRRAGPLPARVNPYLVGRPVRDPSLFVGREPLVAEVLGLLRAGSVVMLLGERRIGKTSLLLQIGQRWRAAGGTEIYIDLEGSKARGPLRAVHDALSQEANRLGLDAMGSAAELAERIARAAGPLLLALDEVDVWAGEDALEIAAFGRTLVHPDARVSAVMAGVEAPALELGAEGEPPVTVVERLVPPLEPMAARQLFLGPVAGRLRVDEAVVRDVLARAQGRPMRVQLFGLYLVDRMASTGRRRVDLTDLRAVVPQVEHAWAAISESGLQDQEVPLELDAAITQIARLQQEVRALEHEIGGRA